MNPDLIIVRGRPHSGKSKRAAELLQTGKVDLILEVTDFFKDPISGQVFFDRKDLPEALSWMYYTCIQDLALGKRVAIVGLFLKKSSMLEYVDFCQTNNLSLDIISLPARASEVVSPYLTEEELKSMDEAWED